MIYCPSCGAPNEDGTAYCHQCGTPLRGNAPGGPAARPPADTGLDSSDRTWIFLGTLCISPLLGIVLYFVWKDSKPQKAKDVCTLTWWAVGVWVALFAIFVLLGFMGALMGAAGS